MVFRESGARTRHHALAAQVIATAIVLFAIALPGPASAAGTLYLQYRHWQPYSWPNDEPTAKDISRSQRGLGWRYQGATSTVSLDYDYQPLRIRTGTPAHNGHLHRLTFGGDWQHNLYHLETEVGVAGSSNMFKHQDFHRQVLNGRLAVFRAWHEGSDLSVGVGGDHRFGGGHATLVRASDSLRAATAVFEPQPGPLAGLSRRLKEQFDPKGVLNPGKMG